MIVAGTKKERAEGKEGRKGRWLVNESVDRWLTHPHRHIQIAALWTNEIMKKNNLITVLKLWLITALGQGDGLTLTGCRETGLLLNHPFPAPYRLVILLWRIWRGNNNVWSCPSWYQGHSSGSPPLSHSWPERVEEDRKPWLQIYRAIGPTRHLGVQHTQERKHWKLNKPHSMQVTAVSRGPLGHFDDITTCLVCQSRAFPAHLFMSVSLGLPAALVPSTAPCMMVFASNPFIVVVSWLCNFRLLATWS